MRYQPEVLNEVLNRISARSDAVAVFDLDETLLNSRPRSAMVLRELGTAPDVVHRFPSEAAILRQVQPAHLRSYILYVDQLLADVGIHNTELASLIEGRYLDRYLSNRYCELDPAMPGAVAYVNSLHRRGGLIVYLTGRNAPAMAEGTVLALRRNGFPMGAETALLMKPARELDDIDFKGGALAHIARRGKVEAAFDNEPASINALKQAFPNSIAAFIHNIHSARPDRPRNDVVWLQGFTESCKVTGRSTPYAQVDDRCLR